MLERVLGTLQFAFEAYRELKSRHYDIVHAQTWKSALPVLAIRRRHRPPMILHCHGSELVRGRFLSRLGRRVVVSNSAALIAVSQYTANLVEPLAGQPVFVIPPGIDQMPTKFNHYGASETLRILSVGELVSPKGHDELIQCVSAARSRGAKYSLTIVGAGPMRDRLLEMIRSLDAADWAALTGPIPDDELQALYERSDIFALLTKKEGTEFEGFGIVFIEAAAHGLPVVSGPSGAVRETICPKCGFVVSNPEEAVEALVTLFRDPELRRAMGGAGREHAKQFLPERLAPQFLAAYRQVVENESRRASL